jgi:hypothetical protein
MFKHALVASAAVLALSQAHANVLLSEGFDDITALPGWVQLNESVPVGTTSWFQGNASVFEAHSGAANSYIGANFNNTSGVGTIANWLMTPELSFALGADLSFYSRAIGQMGFPDRLEVRLSTAGASTDPADFGTLLLAINPDVEPGVYPEAWTEFTASIPAGGMGRIGFFYTVPDAGPFGDNSNYIGIDTVTVTAVPEPGTWLLMGLGIAGLAGWARRRTAV